jgi:RNA polymerase sigma-70 factor (ECF subfamily)
MLQCFQAAVKQQRGGGIMDKQDGALARARRGDADAFAELVSPFSGMVYRHCLQMLGHPPDAEDAAQEAMIRAYRAMPRFLGKSSVATWLFRISHNTCLDMLKKPSRKQENVSLEELREAGFDPGDSREQPDVVYQRATEAKRLTEAVLRLPVDQQALLNLRYGEDMSYEQMARVTGLREGTIKSKLSRAKAKLKALLE